MSILSSTGILGPTPVLHPDSDGKPMADNTKQFEWIQVLSNNLATLFDDRPDVFVAGICCGIPTSIRPRVRPPT